MKDAIISISGQCLLGALSGQTIRDEATAWVTFIGSAAITIVTIALQVYRLIRDRDDDKKKDENKQDEEKENEEK